MRIDYTDRTKETLLVEGVNAKWFEGYTLQEVITMAMTGSVDMSLFMVKDMYDKNGNGFVDKADHANMSSFANRADTLTDLTLTATQLNNLHKDYESKKIDFHKHTNKNVLDNFSLVANGLAFDNKILATKDITDQLSSSISSNTIAINTLSLKAHQHENKSVIDQLTDLNGELYYKGLIIGGSTQNVDLTQVSTHILPAETKIYDIGSPEKRFRSIYVDEAYLSTNTLYIGDIPVLGTDQDTIVVKADPDQSIIMRTFGTGDSKICSDNNVEIISKGLGSNVTLKAEGNSSKVNLTSTSQINLEAPTINILGNLNFTTASVTDFTVKGNLTVEGTTTTINSANLSITDNIIEINKGQTGKGVALGEAGIKIDRGDDEDYFILFDETEDLLKAGTRSGLKILASRDWVTSQIPTTNTGDMTKAVYDKDNDGIVDKSKTLDGLVSTLTQLNYLSTTTSNIQTQFNNRYTKTEVDSLLDNYTPGNVDLTNYYTKLEVDTAINAIELTPGPQGPQGFTGPKGDTGQKGDKGDIGPQGPAGISNWEDIVNKPDKVLVEASYAGEKLTITYDDGTTKELTIQGGSVSSATGYVVSYYKGGQW